MLHVLVKLTKPRFVWFWAGHGVNVPDFNGDEKDCECTEPECTHRLEEYSTSQKVCQKNHRFP